jgi:RNA ligase
MNISDLFDPALLKEMLDGGYVSTQTVPMGDLTIYNYSPSAVYERIWNDVTTQCRGLIVETATGEVLARPFAKFYNYTEALEMGMAIPDGDPVVTEKMDGSLGIIYTHEGNTAVATRGSFTSDQATWATTFLRQNFPDFAQPEGVTTLVEIIYPENRIVVDYDGAEGLWLLGAVDNETGADIAFEDIDWWPGHRTPHHGIMDTATAVALGVDDRYEDDEGVVLCWPRPGAPSVRLKVKHPRYVELHRIVTGLSTRTVWESLANGTFNELLGAAPDEFHRWIRGVESELRDKFDEISKQAWSELVDARHEVATHNYTYTRRDLAEQINKNALYPGLCFAIEDGKDIAPRIWQQIKPERTLAMIVEEV